MDIFLSESSTKNSHMDTEINLTISPKNLIKVLTNKFLLQEYNLLFKFSCEILKRLDLKVLVIIIGLTDLLKLILKQIN